MLSQQILHQIATLFKEIPSTFKYLSKCYYLNINGSLKWLRLDL